MIYFGESPTLYGQLGLLPYFTISFSVSIENHPCYPNKEKTYKLIVYSCNIFPVIDPNANISPI